MTDDLETPTLLLAMPQVDDPFFRRSVVLLMAHGSDGSVGVVVNRPADLTIEAILEDMQIHWGGSPEAQAFVGGPVQPQVGTVLYADQGDSPIALPESLQGTEVAVGLRMTQSLGDLEQLAAAPPSSLRFLLGHAGWSQGQLIQEVLRNDWLMAPIDLDLIFQDDPDTAWQMGLRSVGVDPSVLASLTHSNGIAN